MQVLIIIVTFLFLIHYGKFMKSKTLRAATASLFLAALAACGGGGDGSTTPTGTPTSMTLVVTGTAATGLAISGGTVTSKCNVGTGTAITQIDGSYTLSIADGQLPCVMQITNPVDGIKLHTVVSGNSSTATATANITPLTEMVTARVLGSEPNVFFASFDAAVAMQKITSTAVQAAQTDIGLVINGIVDANALGNFMSAPFKAATQSNLTSGDAHDKLLDALMLRISHEQIGTVATAFANNQTTDDIKQLLVSLVTAPTNPPTPNTDAENAAPVANAGIAQTVAEGSMVTLDGSASSDANGDTLAYAWTLTSRPDGSTAWLCCDPSSIGINSPSFWQENPAPLNFGKANTVQPIFHVDIAGTYVASLIVSDGKVNSTAATVAINVPVDDNAPTSPTGLTVTAKSSNSVTLAWSTSTGGAGGVYSYQIYRNGYAIGHVTHDSNTPLTFTDGNLIPGLTRSYSVAATSVSGSKSLSSTAVSVTTMDISLLKAKLTPFIIFETTTGKVLGQAFASPGVITAAAPLDGYSVIAHPAIDTANYGIKSIGAGQYGIYSYSTGAIVEEPMTEMVLSGLRNGSASFVTINLDSGKIQATGGGQTTTLLLNISGNAKGGGGYLNKEIL